MEWNGDGYLLADCSSRTWTLLRDCMCKEDCHALFVEFKERKTICRAIMLVKKIAASLSAGLIYYLAKSVDVARDAQWGVEHKLIHIPPNLCVEG